jgi:hypothetical protein
MEAAFYIYILKFNVLTISIAFLLNNFSGTVHRLTIVKTGVFIILLGNQLDA